MYRYFFKRIVDFTIALIGLLILSPILIIITIALYFANNGKPFFFQSRPGKDESIFTIIKFKTMNDKKDIDGNLLSDEFRLTKVGSLIRKTSVDEIPQLVNVLFGKMSIVGPRPLLPEYLTLYNDKQKLRHNMKPGITGWTQINGRNAISWDEKFELDVWYVKNCTFFLDCKIIAITIKKVFISEGISAKDSVTMNEFKGN